MSHPESECRLPDLIDDIVRHIFGGTQSANPYETEKDIKLVVVAAERGDTYPIIVRPNNPLA